MNNPDLAKYNSQYLLEYFDKYKVLSRRELALISNDILRTPDRRSLSERVYYAPKDEEELVDKAIQRDN